MVVAVAVGLLGAAAILWTARIGLRALLAANIATALAGIVWLALAGGFSSGGRAIVVAAAAALVGLAAAEAATLRR